MKKRREDGQNCQELHDLYFSHDIFKVMKLCKMRWVRLCNKHGGEEIDKGIGWGENLKGHYLDDRRIILNRILQNHAP